SVSFGRSTMTTSAPGCEVRCGLPLSTSHWFFQVKVAELLYLVAVAPATLVLAESRPSIDEISAIALNVTSVAVLRPTLISNVVRSAVTHHWPAGGLVPTVHEAACVKPAGAVMPLVCQVTPGLFSVSVMMTSEPSEPN